MRKEILRIQHLCKRVGSIEILKDFCMNLYEGEILGVMGLKGSGKSLLFHILIGEEEFDTGTLFFDENLVCGKKALKKQIALVEKESQLQKNMSVMDNIFHIRKHYHHQILVHEKQLRVRTKAELEEIGVHIDPDTLISQLSSLESYMIEIIKKYIIGARIIILDDFSEERSAQELLKLNELLEKLKGKGVSFILAGYQMKNLQMCAERILFLVNGAAGKVIINTKRNQIDENLIFQIFPSKLVQKEKTEIQKQHPFFSAREVCTKKLQNISFSLYPGEILTLVDFDNTNNQRLFECMNNPEQIVSGNFFYHDHVVSEKDFSLKDHKILFVDFNLENKIIEQMSLEDNLCMGNFKKVSRAGFYSRKSMEYVRKDFLEWYPSEKLRKCRNCEKLSEQDKMAILLYRIRLKKPQMILCIDPRRYTDALTYQMMKEQLWEFAKSGVSILIMAQNAEQNYGLTDRFLFWEKGQLIEILHLF
ncbi:MAG: sugar ABC transporter ATP-binding protein [Lachnospiraceae bacterium]|nr:sugar ABC transporter ATP-binding protein [Lachnospiraceae bacterium]